MKTKLKKISDEEQMLLHLYAGLAMQCICAGPGARMVADRDQRYNGNNWAEIVASNAYDFAEAMILEDRKRFKNIKVTL